MRYLIAIIVLITSTLVLLGTPDLATARWPSGFCEKCVTQQSCWLVYGAGSFCHWIMGEDGPYCLEWGRCGIRRKPTDMQKMLKNRSNLPADAPPEAIAQCPRKTPLPPLHTFPSSLGEIQDDKLFKSKGQERFYGRGPLQADWKHIQPVPELVLIYIGNAKERAFQAILHNGIEAKIPPLSVCEKESDWKPSMLHTSWEGTLRLDVQANLELIEIVNAEVVEANWHDTRFEKCIVEKLQRKKILIKDLVSKFGQFVEGNYRIESEVRYYY